MKYFNLILATAIILTTSYSAVGDVNPVLEQVIEKNYVGNGGFENGIAGWKAYKNTAQAAPVSGTGGSPTTTVTTSTSTPIAGKSSGLFTHPAANAQGEGIAISFVTDKAARGRLITISGMYEVVSGTYSGGSSSTDSDVEVYIYDVDSSTIIQPAGYKLDGSATGNTYPILATFQPINLTSVNYRLILHSANVTATAFQLRLDQIKVGIQNKSQGPPVTDWVTYTPVWGVSSGSTNVGTTGTLTGRYRRVGDSMQIQFAVVTGGTGISAGTSGSYTISLPTGFSIDTAKITTTGSLQTQFGYGQLNQGGVNFSSFGVNYSSSTAVLFYVGGGASPGSLVGQSVPAANWISTAGNSLAGQFTVPIVGWSSTVLMSDSSDSRVVVFAANATTPSNSPTGTQNVSFGAASEDTHGGWNGTDTYTIQVPGWYEVNSDLIVSSSGSTSASMSMVVSSSSAGAICNASDANSSSTQVRFRARCTGIKFLPAKSTLLVSMSNSGIASPTWQGASSSFSVKRISGPSQIAASESVVAQYHATASTTTSSTVPINFDAKDFDSHGAATVGASWKYSAPTAGVFMINYTVQASSNQITVDLYKNGTFYTSLSTNSSASNGMTSGSVSIKLLTGEYVDLRGHVSTAIDTSTNNRISITRVGN